jgi:predicted ATPase
VPREVIQSWEAKAETAFIQAMQIAHAQDARLLELRAATSLANFWICQGQRERAQTLLMPLLEWFTEGFDTPDLRYAQALFATRA